MPVVTMASGLHPLKIGVVGDSMVGKTCLIGSAFNFFFIIVFILWLYTFSVAFTHGIFPSENEPPTLFDNYAINYETDNQKFNLSFWDTNGLEFNTFRTAFSYPNVIYF